MNIHLVNVSNPKSYLYSYTDDRLPSKGDEINIIDLGVQKGGIAVFVVETIIHTIRHTGQEEVVTREVWVREISGLGKSISSGES